MRKVLLSLAVVAVFAAYSIHTRTDGSDIKVAPPKTTAANTDTPPATTNPAPNPGSSGSSGMMQQPMMSSGQYRDGTYTGSVEDAFYGLVQVQAVIQNGKIASVRFLQRPNDNPTTRAINDQAGPYLVQEAIQAQSARVDVITGATDTSMAFIQSLTAALSHAG